MDQHELLAVERTEHILRVRKGFLQQVEEQPDQHSVWKLLKNRVLLRKLQERTWCILIPIQRMDLAHLNHRE